MTRGQGSPPCLGTVRFDKEKLCCVPRSQGEEVKRVKQLAEEFAAKVLELKFSLAEIISFLLGYKQSPREAINNIEIWMTRIKEERKEAKNEA
jgi:hypothetical protein